MKTLMVSLAFFSSSWAASLHYSVQTSPLSHLLQLYYHLKNDLVNSETASVSKSSAELLQAIKGTDAKSLPPADAKIFISLRNKLLFDAKQIAEVKELPLQREHFASLSTNMYSLAKAVNLSSTPVYHQFCPMKNAYWLSSETTIRNPYYGKNMLGCGEIKDTLQ